MACLGATTAGQGHLVWSEGMSDTQSDGEAIAVYNEHVAVISELKKSQWQHGVTMFALFGALIALRGDIQHALNGCWLLLFAIVVPVSLAGGGICVAYKLHEGLTRRRQLIWRGRKFLSRKARDVYSEKLSEEPEPTWRTDMHVPVLTCLAIILGAALCGWLLWMPGPVQVPGVALI